MNLQPRVPGISGHVCQPLAGDGVSIINGCLIFVMDGVRDRQPRDGMERDEMVCGKKPWTQ